MARALLLWLAATALGAALVALLPEHWFGGGVLFRFSDRHGPSAADAIGLAIALAGWLFYLRALWVRRNALRPPWLAGAVGVVAVAALAACITAITLDQDQGALALGALSFAAQAALAFTAHRDA